MKPPIFFSCVLVTRVNFFLIYRSAGIHTVSLKCAGHNKWSKIKRKKALADMERSQYTHVYVQKIISAIKTGGSSDPEKNFKLGSIVQQAKSAGVPKSNIESAIKKAVSKVTGGESADSILLNGRGVGGYLMLIEAVTDNIKRTRPQIRRLLEKNGAVLSDPGSSSFSFEHKALVQVPTSTFSSSVDPLELAIEIGAEDVDTVSTDESQAAVMNETLLDGDSSGDFQFKCDVGEVRHVLKVLREKGVDEFTTSFDYLPKTLVDLSQEDYEQACQLVEIISEHEDVVEVYSNFRLHT